MAPTARPWTTTRRPTSASIIAGIDGDVDAIVSGHTHLEYNCDFTGAGLGRRGSQGDQASGGLRRPVRRSLNQIVFDVNPGTGEVLAKRQAVLTLKVGERRSVHLPPGRRAHPGDRRRGGGERRTSSVPSRSARSPTASAGPSSPTAPRRTAVASRRSATWSRRSSAGPPADPESGSAQIAFMNPGGLRADMVGGITGETVYPKTLTYQAGRQRPAVRQHPGEHGPDGCADQGDPGAAVAARRCFSSVPATRYVRGLHVHLRPGQAAGLPDHRACGSTATPIGLATTYSVTVNSFLASGGDNFTTLAGGTNKQDTGKTDLQAMVDYMAEFADTTPLAGGLRPARRRGPGPGCRPGVVRRRGPREVRPVLAVDDRPAGQAGHHGVGQAGRARRWGPSRSPRRCGPRRTPTATTRPARLRSTS